MQNNCVCQAVISKMLLLHYDIYSYCIYKQHWPNQTQEVCSLKFVPAPMYIECPTLGENQLLEYSCLSFMCQFHLRVDVLKNVI